MTSSSVAGADDDGRPVPRVPRAAPRRRRRRPARAPRSTSTRALERELGHPAPGSPEPALPRRHSSSVSPGAGASSSTPGGQELAQRLGGAGEQREGGVVARDDARRADELGRDRRLARAHREVVADREDGDVGRVDPADQRHVRRTRSCRPRSRASARPSSSITKPHDSPGVGAVVGRTSGSRGSASRASRAGRRRRPCSAPASCPRRSPPRAARAARPGRSAGRRTRARARAASPTWSSWPWVTRTASTRSGSSSEAGQEGLPVEPRIDVDAVARRACRDGTRRGRAR